MKYFEREDYSKYGQQSSYQNPNTYNHFSPLKIVRNRTPNPSDYRFGPNNSIAIPKPFKNENNHLSPFLKVDPQMQINEQQSESQSSEYSKNYRENLSQKRRNSNKPPSYHSDFMNQQQFTKVPAPGLYPPPGFMVPNPYARGPPNYNYADPRFHMNPPYKPMYTPDPYRNQIPHMYLYY